MPGLLGMSCHHVRWCRYHTTTHFTDKKIEAKVLRETYHLAAPPRTLFACTHCFLQKPHPTLPPTSGLQGVSWPSVISPAPPGLSCPTLGHIKTICFFIS